MPQITFDYCYTEQDKILLDLALKHQQLVAPQLGGYLFGREPSLLDKGSSYHYQGTTRMGDGITKVRDGNEIVVLDEHHSVVDVNSKVWNFENLYIGCNGTINVPTTCNSTLTNLTHVIKSVSSICNVPLQKIIVNIDGTTGGDVLKSP